LFAVFKSDSERQNVASEILDSGKISTSHQVKNKMEALIAKIFFNEFFISMFF